MHSTVSFFCLNILELRSSQIVQIKACVVIAQLKIFSEKNLHHWSDSRLTYGNENQDERPTGIDVVKAPIRPERRGKQERDASLFLIGLRKKYKGR